VADNVWRARAQPTGAHGEAAIWQEVGLDDVQQRGVVGAGVAAEPTVPVAQDPPAVAVPPNAPDGASARATYMFLATLIGCNLQLARARGNG